MPKPKLGQNFLTDDHACRRIADSLGDLSTRTVVEIGPGHGAITTLLAPRAARLIAIELDPALVAELRFRFRDAPHVTILNADILSVDLTALAREHAAPQLDVIGNLPYYITSDILLHLFAHAPALARAVVMMQREVADRVAAQPGSRDYGLLSATAQLHAQVESLFTLPPSAFTPPPEVYSTVLRLHLSPHFGAALAPLFQSLSIEPAPFLALLRQAFAQKRKTLANNLRFAGYAPAQLTAAWPPTLPPQIRAEAVPLEAMAHLFHALNTPGAP